MSAKWLVLLSLALLVVGLSAERFTSYRVRQIVAQKKVLEEKLQAAERRQIGSRTESLHYQHITAVAAGIAATQKNAPTDPTQLLRWFAEAAARANVRLLSSRIITGDRESGLVADGAYNRIRFELDVEGEYAPVVRYIESIERAGQPMIVDTFSLFADRGANGNGKMKMFISCLTPAAAKKAEQAKR